jgi:hypothetical protein
VQYIRDALKRQDAWMDRDIAEKSVFQNDFEPG